MQTSLSLLSDSSDVQDHPDALRAALVEDGYVYLPRFIEQATISAVRARVCTALVAAGWLRTPDSLVAYAPDLRFTTESFATVYPLVQSEEEFHRLAFHPRLWTLIEGLLQGRIFCHPAKVARLSAPAGPEATSFTRPHQDFAALHVASDVLTTWIALSPCTAKRQGLRLIPGSHIAGFRPTDLAIEGARPLYLPIGDGDPRWCTAPYEPGDIVVMHSLTVHGGGPNRSDQLRLSADVRYQLTSDPMRSEFAQPHGWPGTPGWDRLCQRWASRSWVEVPGEVELIPFPADLAYGEYLSTLRAPGSALLGKEFA